jgi:hypothetical protein
MNSKTKYRSKQPYNFWSLRSQIFIDTRELNRSLTEQYNENSTAATFNLTSTNSNVTRNVTKCESFVTLHNSHKQSFVVFYTHSNFATQLKKHHNVN